MTTLATAPSDIDALALQIMQAAIAASEQAKLDMHDEAGPLALASALSDFFEIIARIEQGEVVLDGEELAEFGEYGLELIDRLAWLLRRLEIMDQRETIARVYAGLAVWLVRRGVVLDNLEGVADGFAYLANGLNDTAALKSLCGMMEEVVEAASEERIRDEDQRNPWRPWRVLNLNLGIVATRSLDAALMESVFERISRRLPGDMAGFFADGRRRLALEEVPDAVREVMDRYAERWPAAAPH